MITSLGSFIVDVVKLAAALVVLGALLALVAAQGLLLGALVLAPFGWAVPLIAIPATITDLAVVGSALAASVAATTVVAKLNDKI